jgi:hypothetical protein
MTTRKPDDLTDPRFDRAWRAASREEPPRAQDDAIRAAARREAGAGPRRADADTTAVPAALRPERWWWPLAAAATIGAVAIGLLQIAAPDKVGSPAGDTIVSDVPAAPAREKERSDAARDEMTVAPEERASARTIAPPVPAPPPATSAPVPAEKRKQAGVESVAPAPVAEPFPADAAKREAKEALTGGLASAPAKTGELDAGIASGKLAAAPALAGRAASAPEPQRAAAPVATPPTDHAYASRAMPTQDRFAPAPAPAAGSAAPPVAQSAAPAPFAAVRKAQETEDARAPAQAKATALPSADAKSDVRANERAKLPVAEWITLMRKLRDEGRTDEAAKELAAFRAVYPDHERLLPQDLRDWRPAVK